MLCDLRYQTSHSATTPLKRFSETLGRNAQPFLDWPIKATVVLGATVQIVQSRKVSVDNRPYA